MHSSESARLPSERASEKQTFFFIHVMKTAGTTFAVHLRRNFSDTELYPNPRIDMRDPTDVEPYTSIAQLLEIPDARREQIRVYMGHFPYIASELLNITPVTLTILRDPFARTVSVLQHFKRVHHRYQTMTLEEIYDDEFVFKLFIDNHQTKIFSVTLDDEPRALANPIPIDGERLQRAKTNLAKVSIIGFQEEYEVFVDELRTRFGWWPASLDLRARANVSRGRANLSDALRKRIAADNALDVELYEFARDVVAQRRRSLGGT